MFKRAFYEHGHFGNLIIQIFISTTNKLSVILFVLRPHEIITLSIAIGIKKCLLNNMSNKHHAI